MLPNTLCRQHPIQQRNIYFGWHFYQQLIRMEVINSLIMIRIYVLYTPCYTITKTLGSTSNWHQSDNFASNRCLIDVDLVVFVVLDYKDTYKYGMSCLPHGDVIKWKHFPRYCPFVRGIHRTIPLTKASDAELYVFFDLRLNKLLSKQSWGWWFETPSCPLWRHCHAMYVPVDYHTITMTTQPSTPLTYGWATLQPLEYSRCVT